MVNPYGMPRDIKVDDCRYNVDILYVFNLIIANKFIQYSYNTFKYSKNILKLDHLHHRIHHRITL